MQVDIHPEDNDNFEEDLLHIVENSNLVIIASIDAISHSRSMYVCQYTI